MIWSGTKRYKHFENSHIQLLLLYSWLTTQWLNHLSRFHDIDIETIENNYK